MSNTLSPLAEQQRPQEILYPYNRVRLGGDELAVCGVIDLSPGYDESMPDVRLVVLDVGFREKDGQYGPYDIDGSGTKHTFTKPYVLVTQKESKDGQPPQTLTYEFEAEEKVTLGRDPVYGTAQQLGFADDSHISRTHASLFVNQGGGVVVEDLQSKNGVSSKSAAEMLGTVNTTYGYTQSLSDFVHQAGRGYGYSGKEVVEGWGYGEYEQRPIIGRDTPINTGVYPVGGNGGEALVIDDVKYPKELNEVYNKVLESVGQVKPARLSIRGLRAIVKEKIIPQASLHQQDILTNVFEVVSKTLKYDLNATDALARDYQKISLNTYIQEGVGVCRTQAVLSAYLVEKLIKDGRLGGSVSIDRNQDHAVHGGHAWARYRSPSGEVYIIDPAQKYVGPIEQTYDEKNKWDYRRSEDLVKQLFTSTEA